MYLDMDPFVDLDGFDDFDNTDGATLLARQYRRQRSRGRRLATGAIVGIAIAGFLFVAFCLFCCWFCCFRKRRAKHAGTNKPISGPTSGGGGFMSRFRPGNNPPHHAGPGMQQNGYGYGGQPAYGGGPQYGGQQYGGQQYGGQEYGYSNGGVQAPQPTYR